jgi:hypothetical protein
VTVLIGNSDRLKPKEYVPYLEKSGLLPYLYHPHKVPMTVEDWPTLGQMIQSGKRVVFMLDYGGRSERNAVHSGPVRTYVGNTVFSDRRELPLYSASAAEEHESKRN